MNYHIWCHKMEPPKSNSKIDNGSKINFGTKYLCGFIYVAFVNFHNVWFQFLTQHNCWAKSVFDERLWWSMLVVCGFIRFSLTSNRRILHWALGLLLMLNKKNSSMQKNSFFSFRHNKYRWSILINCSMELVPRKFSILGYF